MSPLSAFNNFTSSLTWQDKMMPVLFIGHGSPMNGIQDNEFSARWKKMAQDIPTPKAVLVVSAHWLSKGTRITAMDLPQTIHDFGGFPQELFEVQYPAPGNPAIAAETKKLVKMASIEEDHDWGLDHGTWTVVRHMYPEANIPVLQLSIDRNKGPKNHFELAKELLALRKKGVLIIGSGNMVHNLGMLAWDKIDEPGFGYDWALEINERFKKHISEGDFDRLINFEGLGAESQLAIPTPEHYLPLLYTLGLKKGEEQVSFFNDRAVAGSLTMTSVKIG
ncbi:4,5-DOPA-extradiol-dioxygenase [Salinimicrobium oceani]|uniref:4,5-DOPA dioxygenase extradiol n=1 Tax=Salinimicrobium oceani TaxID=2722702 RepID=A0ABX1CXC5_9FLAO|nr:4,5-DOPA dioxygenase extradiol [Salinimicrobium oceani]NJW51812.1 4,5-DOPA dioxygenase extradiol [Salinimicrobium oceani]